MPLKPLPFREVKRKLEAAGFAEGDTKGSHVKFVKRVEGGTLTAVVPRHREVTTGTLRSVVKQAGLTPEDFERL
jgi:predicted RNA binding protein YcfA (HicA-like mRNA interferase family)